MKCLLLKICVSMPKQTRPDLFEDIRAFAKTQPLSCNHGLPQERSLADKMLCNNQQHATSYRHSLPVQNICVDVQRIASDSNEPHKPLLL